VNDTPVATRNAYHSADIALVDATVGQRLVLGFTVSEAALRRRVPAPFVPSPAPPPAYARALASEILELPQGPNLLVVFNDLLLNSDQHGQPQADASARYVGFNIPSQNEVTGERGMVHFRIFTGNPNAVPGRYRDALLARVQRELTAFGEASSTRLHDHWLIEPESGGLIDLDLAYERGPLSRIVGEQPDFPVWAAADPSILRIYQEDLLFEVIRVDAVNVNRADTLSFRINVPELTDIFSGDERLVSVFGNPIYSRRVFSPRH
jgi:hypothetical protein